MTPLVHDAQSTYAVPLSQSTAPVIEHRCLFTHDLRRKQKRWQDGIVKYHTFNKRVMVYDELGKFIGDSHYAQGQALQEGDELNLDKGGVIVEVADVIATSETDVTDLLQHRQKKHTINDTPSRQAAQKPVPVPTRPNGSAQQAKHRSLGALLHTPGEGIGRVNLPVQSPFEQRYAKESRVVDSHVIKKRRLEDIATADSPVRSAIKPRQLAQATRVRGDTADHRIDLCSIPTSPVKPTWQPSSDGPTGDKTPPKGKESDDANTHAALPAWPPRNLPEKAQTRQQAEPSLPAEPTDQQPTRTNPLGPRLQLATKAPRRALLCQRQIAKSTTTENTCLQRNAAEAHASSDEGPKDKARSAAQSDAPKKTSLAARPRDDCDEESRNQLSTVQTAARPAQAPKPRLIYVDETAARKQRLQQKLRDLGLDEDDSLSEPRIDAAETLAAQRKTVKEKPAPKEADLDEAAQGETAKEDVHHDEIPQLAPSVIEPLRRPSSVAPPVPPQARKHVQAAAKENHRQATKSHPVIIAATIVQDPLRPTSVNVTRSNTQFKPPKGPKSNLGPRLDLLSGANPVTSTLLAKPFQRVGGAEVLHARDAAEKQRLKDSDLGPWSREAFDLFDWRPPDRVHS